MPMPLNVIILAAGHGTRMRSHTPKVLQILAGKPLLEHVINTSMALEPEDIIVVYGESIQHQLKDYALRWVEQRDRLGTAHAVSQALDHLHANRALILYGDVPLISEKTLLNLLSTSEDDIGLVTAEVEDPTGLGRIIRNESGEVQRIVEERDASTSEKAIKEINTGIMLVPRQYLREWLPKIQNHNAQQEYYLTDIIDMAVARDVKVRAITTNDMIEITGVNTKLQLIQLERAYQQRQALEWIEAGCHIIDPNRFDCRGEFSFGDEVSIDINVVMEGKVSLGNHVKIEPNCILRDVEIDDHVVIKANSIIEGSHIKSHSTIGPFARIRPESSIGPEARIGNFVEVKKSTLGQGSKANHLSYIGDATIGRGVNMGAGTITVNYDGKQKYQTIIEDNVFIGCDSQLVAPVCLHEGAFIGAGTTVTKDVPAGCLSLSRSAQKFIDGWVRPSERKE